MTLQICCNVGVCDKVYVCTRINALDMSALCEILMFYSHHILNAEVRAASEYFLLSRVMMECCLIFFGHIVRDAPNEDRHSAVAARSRSPV